MSKEVLLSIILSLVGLTLIGMNIFLLPEYLIDNDFVFLGVSYVNLGIISSLIIEEGK